MKGNSTFKNELETLQKELNDLHTQLQYHQNALNEQNELLSHLVSNPTKSSEIDYLINSDLSKIENTINYHCKRIDEIELKVSVIKTRVHDIDTFDKLNNMTSYWNESDFSKSEHFEESELFYHMCIVPSTTYKFMYDKGEHSFGIVFTVDIDIPVSENSELFKAGCIFYPSWNVYKGLGINNIFIKNESEYIASISYSAIISNINKHYNEYGLKCVTSLSDPADIIEYNDVLRARIPVIVFSNKIPTNEDTIYATMENDMKRKTKKNGDVIETDEGMYDFGDHINIDLKSLMNMIKKNKSK